MSFISNRKFVTCMMAILAIQLMIMSHLRDGGEATAYAAVAGALFLIAWARS